MTKTKKKRTPTDPNMIGVLIRIPRAEHAAYRAAAVASGMTMAAWLRQLARAEAGMKTIGAE